MMTNIPKLIRIIKMSTPKKVLMINTYIHDNGLKEDYIKLSDIIGDMGAESLLNTAIYRIMTPHTITRDINA